MSSLDIHYVEGLGNVTVYKHGNLCTIIPDPVKQEIEYMSCLELLRLLRGKKLIDKEENEILVASLMEKDDRSVTYIVNEVFKKFFKPGFAGTGSWSLRGNAEVFDLFEKKTGKVADFVFYRKQDRNFMISSIYFPDNVLTIGHILSDDKFMMSHTYEFEQAINKFISEIYS